MYLPSGKEAEGMHNQLEPYTEMKFCGVATDRGEHVYLGHNNGIEPGSYTPPPRNFSSAHVQRFKPGAWLPTGVSPEPQIWPTTGTMFGMPIYSLSNGRGTGLPDRLQQRRRPVLQRVRRQASGGCSTKVEVFRAPHEYFDNLPGPNLTKVDEGSTYFAIDQATDDAYFDHESEIVRRNEAGRHLEKLRPESASRSASRSTASTGTVYVTDALNGEVHVFKTTEAPDVSYDPAKAGATTAALSGTVGTAGAGNVTNCKFEWGTTTEYT